MPTVHNVGGDRNLQSLLTGPEATMTAGSSHRTVEISPIRDRRADTALTLGIVAVPGSTVAWGLPVIGGWPFVIGAIVGLVLGVQAWRASQARRALVGAILCGVMTLFTAVYLIAAALS